MIASCSRSIATAISARLNAWRADDLGSHSGGGRGVGNLTRSKRLYLLLFPALLGLGAGALTSCAGRQSSVPPQTAAARVLPPSQEMLPRPHTMPRPARKPTPPPPTGSPVPATDEE